MSQMYHPISGKRIHISELDDASSFIDDRLYTPSIWGKFYTDEADQKNRTYGIEIELNTPTRSDRKRIAICKQVLQVLNRNGKHFHIMRDNSVRNGIEIVSEPMTYNYWMSRFDFNKINQLFTDLNLTATIDTGLHIHVGMEHSRRMKELYLQLFSVSYPLWVHLSDRRVLRLQERYVSTEFFYKKPEMKKRYEQTIKSLVKRGSSKVNYQGVVYYEYNFDDRYTGLNFYNEKTVEFRMFAGTDNFLEIMEYLTLVNLITVLADEISISRRNNVYNLDIFVRRTNTELMLEKAVKYLRFVNHHKNSNRIYYNEFMHLDSHWYQIPINQVKRKDFMLDKKIYKEYQMLLERLKANQQFPEAANIRSDINNLLLNNLSEVVRHNGKISAIGLRLSTYPQEYDRSEALKRYVFLRGVNSKLIKRED
ncbi:MAG: hypothetical protein GX760_01455 [Erysipelothrix sp.]|nr:hypothetical protein [Erysipelothrix sp.]